MPEVENYNIMQTPKCSIHNTYHKLRNMSIYYEEDGVEKQEGTPGPLTYCPKCEEKYGEGELEKKLIEFGSIILSNLITHKNKKIIPKCTRVEIHALE